MKAAWNHQERLWMSSNSLHIYLIDTSWKNTRHKQIMWSIPISWHQVSWYRKKNYRCHLVYDECCLSIHTWTSRCSDRPFCGRFEPVSKQQKQVGGVSTVRQLSVDHSHASQQNELISAVTDVCFITQSPQSVSWGHPRVFMTTRCRRTEPLCSRLSVCAVQRLSKNLHIHTHTQVMQLISGPVWMVNVSGRSKGQTQSLLSDHEHYITRLAVTADAWWAPNREDTRTDAG